MTFWIAAAVMSMTVAALVVLALFRGGREQRAAEADMRVYKDQLKEVERDLARGVLSDAEAKTVRTEVSRRLLEADRAAQGEQEATGTSSGARAALGAGLVATILAGAFGLYWMIGQPGYPDLPLAGRIAAAEDARANRPSQEEAEIEASRLPRLPVEAGEDYLALMDRLRETVASRPDDIEGQLLLARNEAALGNFVAARKAQARAISLMGDDATAEIYADYADILVLAAGGYVSPAAEAAVSAALDRDRANGTARYYAGLLMIQTGRPDLAFRFWDGLLGDSTMQDPWVPAILPQIQGLAEVAGVRDYEPPELGAAMPPPGGRGPTAADVEAAQDMSAEDRSAMIRSMVEGLSERLATEGGPAEDWARLIGALSVLGETDRARSIADEAETVFADMPAAMDTIRAARERAGLQ